MEFGIWDGLLLVLVPVQATCIAYVHEPKHKAFVLGLPVPFTLATLAVGRDVGAANVLGLLLLVGFSTGVYFLHARLKANIVLSIAVNALAYCAVGAALAPVTPHTDTAFWAAAGVVAAAALGLYVAMPYRAEPGHRSPLPVWVKFLAIQGVILCLVALKSVLGGFMTMFPMVAIIAAYEARTCLWTICRRIPVIMLSVLPMMIVVRLSQSRLGLGVGLGLGWMAFLLALSVVGRPGRRERAAQMVGEPNVR